MNRQRAPTDQILYGIHPVREALRAKRRRVTRLWMLTGGGKGRERRTEIQRIARTANVSVEEVSRSTLDRYARTSNHQGVVAAVDRFPYETEQALRDRLSTLAEPALFLVLDGIQDPRNLGAMVRCANVAGADGVVIPKDRSSEVTAVAAKASAGAVEHTPVARVTNLVRVLRYMKDAGLWIAGATPDGAASMDRIDATVPLAIVIGGEGEGLRQLVERTCDVRVAIPVQGEIASLNAAMAAAVLLCEATRQRRRAAG